MKFILLLLSVFYISSTTAIFAQEIHHYEGTDSLPKSVRLVMEHMKQRKVFSDFTDSLFMEGEYNHLINICRQKLADKNLKKVAQYNLVGAYYKVGKSDSSRAIINRIKENTGKHYFKMGDMFSLHYSSLIYYLQNEKNRADIENYIITEYRKENYPKTKEGINLIRLLNNDQWIRRSDFANEKKSDYINWTEQEFKEADRQQESALYELLSKNNGLFTKAEVGEYMFIMQFLLMAHDSDKKHRNLYLSYVKKAADDGICLKTRILDFILRTDVLNMGWEKFKKIEKERTEQLKAEYNIKEDYHFGAF